MKDVSMHPITILAERYPQLKLPIEAGMKDTERYRQAVRMGEPIDLAPSFSFSEDDSLTKEKTPAGEAEVLFCRERADFEHVIQALGYRCEPKPIPKSMGASALRGIINWKKIHEHLTEYLAEGHTDEDEEFSRFTAVKENYLDSLIVLSAGYYSAIPPEKMNLTEEEWISRSVTIRKYHELTHFISQRLFPDNKEALRDEIIADMIGLVAAFGTYQPYAAKLFLGTEGEAYREGGRLQNYVPEGTAPEAMPMVNRKIETFAGFAEKMGKVSPFELLCAVEREKICTDPAVKKD